MKYFVQFLPLVLLVGSIIHGEVTRNRFIIFCFVQVLEVFLRESRNGRVCMLNLVLQQWCWKIVSPHIFLALFPDENFLYKAFIIELSIFFVLRKSYSLQNDLAFLFGIILAYYGNLLDVTGAGLATAALFSKDLQCIFPMYEVFYLQSLVCMIGFDIFPVAPYWHDSFSPRGTLVLAEIALFALYVSILFTYQASNLLKLQRGAMIMFASSLTAFILFFVWPNFVIITQTNPIIWLVSLFSLNQSFGAKISLFWIVCIAVFVYFAQFAAVQLHINRIITRKIFHLLVVVMFIPSLKTPSSYGFTTFALAGAFGVFVVVEYSRVFLAPVLLKPVSSYFDNFLLEKEKNGKQVIITSHISLLLASASSLWLFNCIQENFPLKILPWFGIVTVGVGDAMAAWIGVMCGKKKWSHSNKTIMGSVAAALSMILSVYTIHAFFENNPAWFWKEISVIMITIISTTLAEVFVEANDNLFLPIYSSIVYICLKSLTVFNY